MQTSLKLVCSIAYPVIPQNKLVIIIKYPTHWFYSSYGNTELL